MFIHNFKYSIKTLFRTKSLIFWTFAFPIVLGTLFNLAFANIEKGEKLDIIDIAIISDESFEESEILKTAFKELSNEENEDRLFNTTYTNLDTAKEMLEEEKITGYLIINDKTPQVVVKKSGINETIFKSVTEEVTQTSKIVNNLAEEQIKKEMMAGNLNLDYEKIFKSALEKAQNEDLKLKDTSNSRLSYTMVEFYTLIAMTCLYSGMLAMSSINQVLPNMSNEGKRVAVSPVKKSNVVLASFLASFITALIGLGILFAYTIFILKVDYGDNLPLIMLLGLVGTFAGIGMGLAIGTTIKSNESTKTGILLAVTMLGCFLSGMMGIKMKYVIDKNVPIINHINPANMITDGFYSLYYYDTLDRYWFNIASLLIFSGIMILVSYISLRSQRVEK